MQRGTGKECTLRREEREGREVKDTGRLLPQYKLLVTIGYYFTIH